MSETARAYALVAMEHLGAALAAAAGNDLNEHDHDAQTWAMRIMQSLSPMEADLAWLRNHLACVAQDAGVGTRAIAAVANSSTATISRATRRARDEGLPPATPALARQHLLDAEIEARLTQKGVTAAVARSVRDQLLARGGEP